MILPIQRRPSRKRATMAADPLQQKNENEVGQIDRLRSLESTIYWEGSECELT